MSFAFEYKFEYKIGYIPNNTQPHTYVMPGVLVQSVSYDWLNSDRITEEQWLLYYLRQPYPALMLLKFFHVLQTL